MRCYSCTKLSLKIICDHCAQTLFKPTISTRQIGTLDVISFYNYTNIASLLHTKHKPEGFRIYKERISPDDNTPIYQRVHRKS